VECRQPSQSRRNPTAPESHRRWSERDGRQSKSTTGQLSSGFRSAAKQMLNNDFFDFLSHQRRPRRERPRTDIRRPDILGRHICVRFHVSLRLWWRAAPCQKGRMMRACQPNVARSAHQSTTRDRADSGALIGRTPSPAQRRGVGCSLFRRTRRIVGTREVRPRL
jgi:hypothetical protein